jgi:predicted DNA-binding transcriptional regulator YafY
VLGAINRAIRNSQELAIRYMSLSDESPRTQRIEPEALVLYHGSIYVAAYRAPGSKRKVGPSSGASEAVRFFKLDRVADARVSARKRSTIPKMGSPGASLIRAERAPSDMRRVYPRDAGGAFRLAGVRSRR